MHVLEFVRVILAYIWYRGDVRLLYVSTFVLLGACTLDPPRGAPDAAPTPSAPPTPTFVLVPANVDASASLPSDPLDASVDAPGPDGESGVHQADAAMGDAGAASARGRVTYIGMHIGGGPNTKAAKEPIEKAIEPSFDDMRRCYGHVDSARTGDFGVDLLIEREGGRAKVSDPRTVLRGAGFKECMLKVFEAVTFPKLRTGKTRVSYSVRLSPS